MNSAAKLRVPVSTADHSQGSADAPLVLVEYGDYECPFCKEAHSVTQRLQKTLDKDLRFVFRNFPLTTAHPHALTAAKAAEAAGLQGKFWEMHDLLYENQTRLDAESLLEYAASLRLNVPRVAQDMRSSTVETKIEQDFYGGTRSGVNGTPNFFINGYRYEGDWSFEALLKVLTAIRATLGEEGLKKTG